MNLPWERPTTFLEVSHCESLFQWTGHRYDVSLMRLVSDFLPATPYHFTSAINHSEFDMPQPWAHALTVASSGDEAYIHFFVPTANSFSLLS